MANTCSQPFQAIKLKLLLLVAQNDVFQRKLTPEMVFRAKTDVTNAEKGDDTHILSSAFNYVP